jgi:hypothetical protein
MRPAAIESFSSLVEKKRPVTRIFAANAMISGRVGTTQRMMNDGIPSFIPVIKGLFVSQSPSASTEPQTIVGFTYMDKGIC